MAVASPNPISTNPIANPNNGVRASLSKQNATYASYPLSHKPTTLLSIHIWFIREFKEAIKKVPPNSHFNHPSNYFIVYKDLNGVTRIIKLQTTDGPLEPPCDNGPNDNTVVWALVGSFFHSFLSH